MSPRPRRWSMVLRLRQAIPELLPLQTAKLEGRIQMKSVERGRKSGEQWNLKSMCYTYQSVYKMVTHILHSLSCSLILIWLKILLAHLVCVLICLTYISVQIRVKLVDIRWGHRGLRYWTIFLAVRVPVILILKCHIVVFSKPAWCSF